ncbi:MAG TPA: hypothetical protein PLD77_01345 [Candidatus Dojkabacteria bacterium]|nr:hypothetical protein [Candidatus Dojkabacteria bacterium]
MPDKVSRVQSNEGKDPGSSYRDNKDGTIHVTHHDQDTRTSYDVRYGEDADNEDNALPNTLHTSKQ